MTPGARKQVERIVERYAPTYVLVDQDFQVLQLSEQTGGYVEPVAGSANLNLLSLVRRELRMGLRSALQTAAAERRRVEIELADITVNGAVRPVQLVVEPVTDDEQLAAYLVLFREGPSPPHRRLATDTLQTDLLREEYVRRLEAELRQANERLHATVEEIESANEDLKSSNEELHTVNAELGYRIVELARANSDLKNLLENTQIATVFLDEDLRVKSFTPRMADVFNLIESDLGRPITDVAARVDYPELRDDVQRVLHDLAPVEREVGGQGDARYLIRVLPYRIVDNFIAGVVLTFSDITDVVRARNALNESEARYRMVVESATDFAIITMDAQRNITGWNPGAVNIFGWSEDEMIGRPADVLFTPEDNAAQVPQVEMETALKEGRASDNRWHIRRDRTRFWGAGVMMPLKASEAGFVKILRDRTHERVDEERQKLLMAELQHRVKNILAVVRSIASRTLETTEDLEDFSAHFDGRLRALARTQNVLTRTASGRIDLEELVSEELLNHAPRDQGQIEISGPQISLRNRAAEVFALALHELATNALKYGALAQPRGHIAVTWRVLKSASSERLSLEWRETGVPALDPEPARRGFGRDLIERGLPYELGAAVSLEFQPGGVRCTIELPLDADGSADSDSLKWNSVR